MASATQRALADRAIGAAGLIEFWSNQIVQEMKEQNIQSFDETSTLTLKTHTIEAMLSNMIPLAKEVRELEKNLRKERLRGHKYPSN